MTNLESQWAWSRIEAMADGTLTAAEQQRMRNAMAVDPKLCHEVEIAASLRCELRRLKRTPVPASVRRRLWSIPSDRPRAMLRVVPAAWAVGIAAVAGLVAGVVTLLHKAPTPASPTAAQAQAQAQAEAVEDFAIAMTYLRRSAVIASTEVTTAVGDGLRDALAVSHEAARNEKRERKNGG